MPEITTDNQGAVKNEEDLQETAKPNLVPRGRPGTLVQAYNIDDDHISTLTGVEGQNEFEKMLRSDTQVRKIYHAIVNPIKSADWNIDPASDDQKDIQAASLMKQILFKDIPGGFEQKLDEILTFPFKGHSVFEVIHKNKKSKEFGNYTGLADLGFRDQRTLDQWHFDPFGNLIKVHQLQNGDIPVNEFMDAKTLLIFFNDKKGADLGYSFCRMLYGPYKRKLLAKQLQIIGTERGAIPLPILEVPADVKHDSDAWIAAETQLQKYTNAETAYFMIPFGWKLDFKMDNTFDPSKVQVVIKSENEEMVGAVIAMFLEMGLGGNSGNKAGTESAMLFFTNALKYLANKIKRVINSELIPQLMRLNYGDSITVYPELNFSGISENAGLEFMTIVTTLANAGIIAKDEPLEDFIRKLYKLPKKAEGEMIDNQKTETDKEDTTIVVEDEKEDEKEPVEPPKSKEEIQASDKCGCGCNDVLEFSSKDSPRSIMIEQGEAVTEILRENLSFTASKFIADTMNRYRQLPDAKKGTATSTVIPGGINNLKKELKIALIETYSLALSQVRKEVPTKKNVKLNMGSNKILDGRLKVIFDDTSDVKLTSFSKLPTYAQVLVQKQSDMISKASVSELTNRVAFSFSSAIAKSSDPDIIKQKMEDAADAYITSEVIATKGVNAAAFVTNETRNSFFFDDEVIDELHSFTFVNGDPKSDICTELAGTTFWANDAESLMYVPPLHHGCKSYLRANLKASKGVESLKVTSLSPSAEAKKSITFSNKENKNA